MNTCTCKTHKMDRKGQDMLRQYSSHVLERSYGTHMEDFEGSLAAVVVVLPSSNLGMVLPKPLVHEVLDLHIHTYVTHTID